MATEAGHTKIWTDEELLSLPKDGNKREVLDGELIMSPASWDHEEIASELLTVLRSFVKGHGLGTVLGSNLGCRMASGDLLCPDVSFVARGRLGEVNHTGFFEGAPDLVVEVLSPSDTVERLHRKIQQYFANGTRVAWLVSPFERTVTVYHSDRPDTLLREQDRIYGESILPGFSLRVAELFEGIE